MQSIEDAETAAFAALKSALGEHAGLSTSLFNLIGETISSIPPGLVTDMPSSLKVALSLCTKMSNDFRVVSLLALLGYPVQAATVAASLYESVYIIAYIARNNEIADKWIVHDDPIKPFISVAEMTKSALSNLGVTDSSMVNKQYAIYSQLCMAKHANPIVQKMLGISFDDGLLTLINGPDTSLVAERMACFALENAMGFVLAVALSSFIKNHIHLDKQPALYERLKEVVSKFDKLREISKRKYGTGDPFPGKWKQIK